jgi:hypothetical protein
MKKKKVHLIHSSPKRTLEKLIRSVARPSVNRSIKRESSVSELVSELRAGGYLLIKQSAKSTMKLQRQRRRQRQKERKDPLFGLVRIVRTRNYVADLGCAYPLLRALLFLLLRLLEKGKLADRPRKRSYAMFVVSTYCSRALETDATREMLLLFWCFGFVV